MNYGKNKTIKKQSDFSSHKTMKHKRIGSRFFKIMGISFIIGIIVLIGGAYTLVNKIMEEIPEITAEDVSPIGYTTFIVDQDGNEVEKLVQAGSNRIYVELEEIPTDLINAFVAIEDSRFYEHKGIDPVGIMRAAVVGLTSGGLTEGASTITQQLIKNTVFTNFTEEKTLWDRASRKVQEIFLALELEKIMTKDEILENYLNIINLGQNSLGVQSAAIRYFDKDVSELTLSECTTIAGITKNPTGYNPITYPENNLVRRTKVLNDMLAQEYIEQEDLDEALEDNVYDRIIATNVATVQSPFSYFTDALIDDVLTDLQEDLGYTAAQASYALYSGGLRIYSTQNADYQAIADEEMKKESNYPSTTTWSVDFALSVIRSDADDSNYSTEMFETWAKSSLKKSTPILFSSKSAAEEAVESYKKSLKIDEDDKLIERLTITPQPQASFVLMDQTTGYVLAIVGGRGEKEQSLSLNRATDSMRQPGSTFKMVSAYGPALDLGAITLATTLKDSAFTYDNSSQVVTNAWSGYSGNQTVRTAIEKSINTIAVRVITDITPSTAYDYLQSFGFTTIYDSDKGQAMALGGLTYGVTNLELTAAYATIANDGIYNEPILYTKITDSKGKVLIDNTPETHKVLEESTSALLTDAMRGVVTRGTGTATSIGTQPTVGKTGTTNDIKDLWFAGYSPYLTATIWCGFDQPTSMSHLSQSWHKTMWSSIMKRVHANLSVKQFDVPSSIKKVSRCSITGKEPLNSVSKTITKDGESVQVKVSCPTRTEYFAVGTSSSTTTCDGTADGHTIVYPTPVVEPTPEVEVTPTPDVTPDVEVTPTPDATPDVEVTPTPDATPDVEVTPTPDSSDSAGNESNN